MCIHCDKNVPLRNFLTYMDVSACKFTHERTCLYTTCPIISYVLARPTCFHAVCRLHVFLQWTLSFESVKPMFSDIVSCVKSWIQSRVRKLNSCGGTSFRLQMWVVRWKRWCHMLNVTHRHVFVSQKVPTVSEFKQFGTRCLTVCVTQLLDLTNFAVTWRHTSLPDLVIHLQRIRGVSRNALYKSTFTYLLTYKACSCACSHTKRPVSAHFLSYEVISMRNVKHMTPC